MPGLTAYAGLLEIGKPKEGETVVVAAGAGPAGSPGGQIAKFKGCRVVGIAGGAEKCAYLVDALGVDAAVEHRPRRFADQLATALPAGFDVNFDLVGGAVWGAELHRLDLEGDVEGER